jgi:hypothetical protein
VGFFMILPLWALYGCGAAVMSALMMLLQEKLRVNGFAVAFWCKIACALVMLPFVIHFGLPQNPLFYLYLGIGAAMYAISDVIFFNGITKSSAGAVARILPSATILSFLLWFVVKPELLDRYLQSLEIFALIFITLCVSAYFVARLKKCEISMQAVRAVWFVIVAATVGPMLAKMVTLHADPGQGPYAFVFCEALMMLTIWIVFYAVRRPVPLAEMISAQTARHGLMIGTVMAGMVLLNVTAYYNVDNPAYIPAIKVLDSVIILGFYKMTGQPIRGDVLSGLGIVVCAAALIILKAQI